MSKNIYKTVLNEIFRQHYTSGIEQFEFTRTELEAIGVKLGLFELTLDEGEVKVVQEKHYMTVHAHQISVADLQNYRIQE